MIYLRGDPERLARASIVERGAKWQQQLVEQAEATPYQQARGRAGVAGAIAFLQETQALMDEVFATGGWATLTLEVTAAARETHRRALLDFLGLRAVAVTPPALAAALPAYTGTYAPEDPAGTIGTLEVRLEQGGLVLYQPGERLGPLMPVSASRLHLVATPVDVEFEVEEGRARRLVLRWSSGKVLAFQRA